MNHLFTTKRLGLALILLIIAIFANWPREAGSIKPYITMAGFPFLFAMWEDTRLQWLSTQGLILELVISLIVVIGLPMLLFRSHHSRAAK